MADAPQDFSSFQESLQTGLQTTVGVANQLAAADLRFHRTADPDVAEALDDLSDHLLNLANRLLRSAVKVCSAPAVSKLREVEDVHLRWTGIVDVLDSLLERSDIALDEYTGLVKRKEPTMAAQIQPPPPKKSRRAELDRNVRCANIVKPQLFFDRKPDNFPTTAWKPILTAKPHAAVPLEQSLVTFTNSNTEQLQYHDHPKTASQLLAQNYNPAPRLLPQNDNPSQVGAESGTPDGFSDRKRRRVREMERILGVDTTPKYKHPYEAEIVDMTYPDQTFEEREPIKYRPVDEAEPTWVDTFEGVLEMLEELKKADEIAVDLEHHDWRSYVGMVSLMQISTRERDWVVDTLKPWRHRLEILNQVFADPKILKVLHGASMDVIWLQRDLGLYLVGLFDTFFACEELQLPTKSLAYLLKKFVGFDADKKYQMADWRLRPLTSEMLFYARSDTHYLLYIYDMVRNALVAKTDASPDGENFVERVVQKSKSLALTRFDHPRSDPESGDGARGWRSVLVKHPSNYSGEQFAVFRAVWNWRDETARREDESPHCILSQQAVAQIAKILPPDAKALHSLIPFQCFVARQALTALWAVIRDARAKGVGAPGLLQYLGSSDSVGAEGHSSLSGRKRPAPSAAAAAAAVAPLSVPDVDDGEAVAAGPSRLFGELPISAAWDHQPKSTAPNQKAYVPLPWQGGWRQQPAARRRAAPGSGPGSGPDTDAMDIDTNRSRDMPPPMKATSIARQEFNLLHGRKIRSVGPDSDSDESESESEPGPESASRPVGAEVEIISTTADPSQAPDGAQEMMNFSQRFDTLQRESHKALLKRNKNQRRQAKRDSNRERNVAATRAAKGSRPNRAGHEEEQEAFDYAKAASVLHADRQAQQAEPGFIELDEGYNPYAKAALEGVKRGRRAPPIAGERSSTFKR